MGQNMQSVQQVTPQTLLDIYSLMPNEDKHTFLCLLGRVSTAELPFVVTRELSPTEAGRYSQMVFEQLLWTLFPILLREAVRLVKERPLAADQELVQALNERMRESMEEYDRKITALEASKLKEERDRTSSTDTVKRNVEICNLRKQDRKKWTLFKLARHYGVSCRTITLVLKDEEKWRRLAQNAQ
jgi:hypothetical protein